MHKPLNFVNTGKKELYQLKFLNYILGEKVRMNPCIHLKCILLKRLEAGFLFLSITYVLKQFRRFIFSTLI